MDKESFSDLWLYIKTCVPESYRLARKSTDNLVGILLCGLASILLSPWIKESFGLEGDLLEQFTSWSGILFVIVLFFIFRLIFVAPFLVYRRQKRTIIELTEKIDELQDRGDSQPFMNAVHFVMEETEFGKRKTKIDIINELICLGAGDAIKIRGREATLLFFKPHLGSSSYTEIPSNFLRHCTPFDGGFQVGFALIEKIEPAKLNVFSVTQAYLDPKVSMKTITRHYGSERTQRLNNSK
jgi:hypothetical protein